MTTGPHFLIILMQVFALTLIAQIRAAVSPDLTGVYDAVPNGMTLPGGLKNTPETLNDLNLQPGAAAEAAKQDLKLDPANLCQAIGPFRMMAREDNRIELLPWQGRITVLFENASLGNVRMIYLTRSHPNKFDELKWNGDAVARWEGDTLVIDTVGFNDRTWLNDKGAPHSEALHLTERVRPILDGTYLEYKVTAEDPKTLAKPFTYVRYYKKSNAELNEYICREKLN
jgi:hypothetical protein